MVEISATFVGKVVGVLPPREYAFTDSEVKPVAGTTRDVFVSMSPDTEPVRVRFRDDQAGNYMRIEEAGWLAEVTVLGVVRGQGNGQHLSCTSLIKCEAAEVAATSGRPAV